MNSRFINLLYIDDSQEDHELFSAALEDAQVPVILQTSMDGYKAIQMLSNPGATLPDLILLDINMPMDGMQSLIHIKADARLKNIPVLMYTTSVNPVEIQKSYEHGASMYIIKPWKWETLIEVIRKIVSEDFTVPRNRHKFLLSTEEGLVFESSFLSGG